MGIGGISIWQLLIILAIVVMLFGTKRLRGLGSDLGSAIKGFRKSMQDDGDAPEKEKDEAGDTAPGQRSEQADDASNGSHPKP
ncbi:Sec-independent protein translocase family protein [Haliea atlantica]|nr:twin-arginine translocase TatA/TatE family subunit [Haliea sp.]|tara:strand:- start:180313 stop:180561 length:249 start_codon:yes stop_codon:yes gene_type:complete